MRNKNIVNSKNRSEWQILIREWIHNEDDRKMLERFLLDGFTIGQIAEKFNLSTQQAQKRISKAKNQLFSHISDII